VELLGKYGDPFTLAAGVQLFAPTGDRDNFTSDGTFRAQPRLLAAGHIGLFTYAAKIGFEYRPNDATFAGSDLGSALLVGAAAGIQADHGRLVVGPEFWGSTVVTSNEGPFKTRNTPLEALLGGHYQVGDWKLGAGAGPGLTRGYGEPDFRVVADLEWAPPVVEDRDGDGIGDTEDACPDVAGIRTADPRTSGCPDRDRDGVADGEDACPDVPGARSPDPKKNGCPADRDDDGIVDGEDACPDAPGVRDADPKKNGCPPDRDSDGIGDSEDACPDAPGARDPDPKRNGCPPDRDNDDIADSEDACPDAPGVRDPNPKKNGCPPDRDSDGIPDAQDACPNVPGPSNPDPKKNGCPLAYVSEEAKQIKITEQVKFRFNSAQLDPAGDPLLQAVLTILRDHPELQKIEIQGHTDNVGTRPYNMNLSNARARAVLAWLVKHGIETKRLTAKGFGFDVPIADNSTDEGRRENRRVEFHIVDQGTAAEGPTSEGAKKLEDINNAATKKAQ